MKFDKTTIISFLILITGLILEAFGVRCSCIYLTIIYLYLIYATVKKYGITHSYSLFLFSFGVFLMGRVFLDVLGVLEVNHATKWQDYYLTNETVVIVNTSMALSLIFIYVGLNSRIKKILSKVSSEQINNLYSFTKKFIFLLIPFAIVKLYFDFSQIRAGSYTDLYLGLERSPFIIRAGWYLATLTLPILLANTLNKKQFKIFLLIFLLINCFDFLQGSRGALLRPGIFFLWYYYKVIAQKKANSIIVSIIFILFAFVGNMVLEMRGDQQGNSSGPLGKVMYVFESLGGSYYFNVYYVDFHKEIDGIDQLYVIGPVLDGILGFIDRDYRGQSEYRVKKGYGLSHKMTYYIAPTSYQEGHGLGCSYIAEIYSTAGLLSLILFSFFIGKFLGFVELNLNNSPVVRVISWSWIQSLAFMARGELLSFTINMSFTLIIFYLLLNILKRRKRSCSHNQNELSKRTCFQN